MMRMQRGLSMMALLLATAVAQGQTTKPARVPVDGDVFYVNPIRGSDSNPGTQARPWKSVSSAVARLPDPVTRNATIFLASGDYKTTGGQRMPLQTLELMRRMRPGVVVRFIGSGGAGAPVVLGFEGSPAVVQAVEGHWGFEGVQIGSGETTQDRGVQVTGPTRVDLRNVTFRTRSESDAGIYATRGGRVSLYGAIRMNEHLHDTGGDETFCGILAEDHGSVEFAEREGASLDIGNGNLSCSRYGFIRLGCEKARITSWSHQSNTLAINNSGRIDLHDTPVVLRARDKDNKPIGLEHDGHILAEGAHVIIEGSNGVAIALQKASTFTCNDIELRGQFGSAVWATSGSTFVGRFLTDVGRVEAMTGANVSIEEIKGTFVGPALATRCGRISLPDRDVWPATK